MNSDIVYFVKTTLLFDRKKDNFMRRKKFEKFRTNPFLEHTAEISTTGYRKIFSEQRSDMMLVVNPDDGEIKPAGFYYRHEVEQNEFVKLYSEGAAAFLGLKSAGTKVFQLVYGQLYGKEGKNKTEIVLNYELLSESERKLFSKRTFERGVIELLQANFIAESVVASYYFINTAYLFNGDRLAMVKEYVLKKQQQFEVIEAEASDSFETKLEAAGQETLEF